MEDVPELHRTFSAHSSHIFDLKDPLHYAALLHTAQHHGYPTPLLDWTRSPFVAAFFAFANIQITSENRNAKVRIFRLNARLWNASFNKADKIFPMWPNVTVLNPIAFGNPRATPQQAVSTLSNVDDIEEHVQTLERASGNLFLEAFDLPVFERDDVMRELRLMGITAASLFPGLDGAFKALKEGRFSQPLSIQLVKSSE